MRQSCEIETNIVSVERIKEYIDLPSEKPLIMASHRPDISWPEFGAIEFRNYSTRYRAGLELVLNDVSLSVKPAEKIGIVGRTGAGKSSMMLSLFRLIEPVHGTILIDGVDITGYVLSVVVVVVVVDCSLIATCVIELDCMTSGLASPSSLRIRYCLAVVFEAIWIHAASPRTKRSGMRWRVRTSVTRS